MPVTLSPNKFYAKNQAGTAYLSANVISDQTTDEMVARIQSKADEVTAQLANAAEVENMFAGAFSTFTAYTAGQYVIQTITSGGSSVNKLFRFTADHAAGAWTGTDAVEVKICNDVSDLKSALNDTYELENFKAYIEKGKYWGWSDGQGASSSKYARTASKEIGAKGYRNAVEMISNDYTFCVHYFDSTKTFMYSTSYGTGIVYFPKTAYFIGMSFKKTDGTNVSDQDVTNMVGLLHFYKQTDDYLTKTNIPSDADAIGQTIRFTTNTEPIPINAGYILAPSSGKLNVNSPTLSLAGYSYGIVSCNPGDMFCVNGQSYNGTYPLAWYFLDSEYNILNSEEQNVIVTNKLLTAPANAAYFVVHTKNPQVLSFKGVSPARKISSVSDDLSLYKRGLEPLEMGTINDTTGRVSVQQGNNRIRCVNLLPIDIYKSVTLNVSGFRLAYYAYADDKSYIGYYDTLVSQIESSSILNRYPSAKYYKFIIYKHGGLNDDISSYLDTFIQSTKYGRYNNNEGTTYPVLSSDKITEIVALADAYYAIKGNFKYYGAATMNNYAGSSSIYTSGKYKICCSLLASLLWMGRSATDFSNLESYSNSVTKAFDYGYYFEFIDRSLYQKKGDDFYGFTNPFDREDYEGSYSWNTYYSSGGSVANKKQTFNPFMYANDMAKEMDRLGYTIPVSELMPGDLIFTKSPVINTETNVFECVAYKNINHVAMVYSKTASSIAFIESSSKFDDAIAINSSTGSDLEKVRVGYLMSQIVMCARHPAAWGNGGNVPSTITTR